MHHLEDVDIKHTHLPFRDAHQRFAQGVSCEVAQLPIGTTQGRVHYREGYIAYVACVCSLSEW